MNFIQIVYNRPARQPQSWGKTENILSGHLWANIPQEQVTRGGVEEGKQEDQS